MGKIQKFTGNEPTLARRLFATKLETKEFETKIGSSFVMRETIQRTIKENKIVKQYQVWYLK